MVFSRVLSVGGALSPVCDSSRGENVNCERPANFKSQTEHGLPWQAWFELRCGGSWGGNDGRRLIFVSVNLPFYFFKLSPGRSYPVC